MIARQAQLNALLDLDKNDHQVAPEAEDDNEPPGEIIRQPIPPPRVESTLGFIRQLYVATVGPLRGCEPPWSRPERTAATPLEPGSSSRQFDLNERIGLIWSDRVNFSGSVDLFLSLLSLFPEDRSSSSLGWFERRLISLIFAGRNRIIMIRRELPLTVIASPVEPVA